jgi:hypothetical protein
MCAGVVGGEWPTFRATIAGALRALWMASLAASMFAEERSGEMAGDGFVLLSSRYHLWDVLDTRKLRKFRKLRKLRKM